jgi:hypothetical protein
MVATVATQVSQAGSLGIGSNVAVGTKVSQARTLAIYNFPTAEIRVSQARASGIVQTNPSLKVSQARALAIVRGRVYNPKLRAWTFNLDGHQFWVLRLGEDKTLLYDLGTKQWAWWSSDSEDHWTVNLGLNWRTGGPSAKNYGSNIVVGDDSHGLLWILNPEQNYDEVAITGAPTSFIRVAEAFQITRGRGPGLPCYEVYLTASGGFPASVSTGVALYYSDDSGNTYVNAGAITVNTADYTQEFAWRSLGQVGAPGRIYQIRDDGAFARIDGLEINNGSAAAS